MKKSILYKARVSLTALFLLGAMSTAVQAAVVDRNEDCLSSIAENVIISQPCLDRSIDLIADDALRSEETGLHKQLKMPFGR